MTTQRIYTFCLLLSGAAGLIYQIVWVRMLSLVFGNTVYAVSMVVAGFLAGLALGGYAWGRRADRMARPVNAYIGLEVGIALSALAVSGLIYMLDETIVRLMTVDSIASGHWQAVRFAVMFLILLVPTSLMGGTLPVMSTFYIKRFDRLGRGIGSLYAANTYGAMAGCFLAGYLMVREMGMWGALGAAFFTNALVAALAWLAAGMDTGAAVDVKRKSTPKPKKKKKSRTAPAVPDAVAFNRSASLGFALSLSALAGFSALAYEILWTRAFVISFKSTVYLFSNLLTVYLLGLALGSHVFSKRLDGVKDHVRLFGMVQVGIGVWGLLTVPLMLKIPEIAVRFGAMLGEMNLSKDVLVTLSLMTLLMGLPTFLMGLSYPLICKVTTESLSSLGRYTGLVYAVGTVGGIAGSLGAGFVLLPALGLQNSLFAVSLLAIGVGYTALLSIRSRRSVRWVFPASASAALIVVVSVGISGVNIGFGAGTEGNVVFAREGIMGTVRVIRKNKDGPLTLLVNNYQLATSGDVAVRFGHVPLIIKQDARDVLLISLGSGITAGSVGRHPVNRIDCVEIVPSLYDVQPLFARDNHNIVADKRFHLTFWDGRHYVRTTKRTYDLVISDLYQPDSAGVGNLYALEHFLNVKAKLKQGGAMAQWLPLYQLGPDDLKVIMRTFAYAFEHVQVWAGDINSRLPTLLLYGSPSPIRIRPDELLSALEAEGVKEDMIEHSDPLSFLSFYVMDRPAVLDYTEGHPINTDNRPVIEYNAPMNIWKRQEYALANFLSIMQARRKINLDVLGAEGDEKMARAIERYFEGRTLTLRGKVENARRNYSTEIKNYQQAARLTPSDPFLGLAVFDLGYLYYHRRDFRTASKILDWAKQIDPNLMEAHFYLAKSYQNLGMTEESMAALSELARLRPDIAETLTTTRQ